jgi:hypothetical protein
MSVKFRFTVILLPLAVAACGGGSRSGPYVSYRAPGVRNYAAPGSPADPWGPYIREAAARYAVPETFIREVMRQESGGHEYLNGELITSSAGAMGLMQVMPATYAVLSERNGLGSDAYDPHDNIMAGTALIRDLYEKYGSPAFLAAYDAGPRRLDDYLAGRGELPNETIAYLDNVAPRLVGASPMTGPLVAFAGNPGQAPPLSPVPAQAPLEVAEAVPPPQTLPGSQVWQAPLPAPEMAPQPAAPAQTIAPPPPPASVPQRVPQMVAQAEPRMVLVRTKLPPRQAQSRFALIPSAYADTPVHNYADVRWGVQVGAFGNPAQAHEVADTARTIAPAQLRPAHTVVAVVSHADGRTFYRARLVGMTEPAADIACRTLTYHQWQCVAVPPGG